MTNELNLPEGWEVKKLGDVFDKKSSNVSKNKIENDDGDYPIFGAKGLIKNVSFYHQDKNYIAIIKDGAGVGRHSIYEGYSSVIGTLQYLIPKDCLDINFAYYFLLGMDFNKYVNGSTIPHIYFKDYKNENILIPSIPEQIRIVAILDEAFESIAKAKENAEKNVDNTKEIFERYLQRVLKNKKWAIKTLGDVCEKVEYGSSSKSIKEGKIAVLRMGNIQNGRLNWEKLVYSDNLKENEKYLLKYNDVLFNRTNSPELVGKTAIYKDEMPAIFAGYLIRIHRMENLLDADYLNYYLNSEMAMNYGKSVTTSSVNQANINGTKLKSYPIPLPLLSEQKSIVKKLDAISSETKKLEAIYTQKLADLEELKKSILQKAFNGELTEASA